MSCQCHLKDRKIFSGFLIPFEMKGFDTNDFLFERIKNRFIYRLRIELSENNFFACSFSVALRCARAHYFFTYA